MIRIVAVTAICSVAAASLADSNLAPRRISGARYARYDIATGRLMPTPYGERYGNSIWDMTNSSPYYFGNMAWSHGVSALVTDWGDIIDGALVDAFTFAYGTDLSAPTTIDFLFTFYSDYDGFNNNGYYATYAFCFTGLPTASGAYNSWEITVDLAATPNSADRRFRITGNDLDGDGMADFGYSFWFPCLNGANSATGPVLSNPDLTVYETVAAAEAALGIVDTFDSFLLDPGDPNRFVYNGTYWFGGGVPGDPNTVYSQFYLGLYGAIPCGGPGASGNFCDADIDGSGDCAVGLADLCTLLANYGATSGVTHDGGDLEGNDGDVDLADLAALLAQYGDDCGL